MKRVWIAVVKGRHLQLRWIGEDGKERRRSTGTNEKKVAERLRRELEAKLLLNRPVDMPKVVRDEDCGPEMDASLFVNEYDRIYLTTLRDGSRSDALSRLNRCVEVSGCKTLGELATRRVLETIQAVLRDGRSAWTVKGIMAALFAALKWAKRREWIDQVPEIDRIKTARLKAMKGRPLALEEFERILQSTHKIVGNESAPSWKHTLRGYWESGLRRDELLAVSWDDPEQIRPAWDRGRFPVLLIPSSLQKNETEEEIPILPGFEALLLETPEGQRTGWVFNPQPLPQHQRRRTQKRLQGPWVSRVISKISKEAGVATFTRGGQTHFATVHDLRRSLAQRLLLAEVDRSIIKAVMRHSSWETTERHYAPGSVQKMASDARAALGNQVRVPDEKKSRNERKSLTRQ